MTPPPRREWKVDPRKGFDLGKNWMKAGCRHRTGKTAACGGCYARLYVALETIAKDGNGKAIAEAVFEAMKAEGKDD